MLLQTSCYRSLCHIWDVPRTPRNKVFQWQHTISRVLQKTIRECYKRQFESVTKDAVLRVKAKTHKVLTHTVDETHIDYGAPLPCCMWLQAHFNAPCTTLQSY